MAFNQRVGRAVLELTTDSASYNASIAKAKTDAKQLGDTWKGTETQLKGMFSSLQANAAKISGFTKEFSGDRLIASAHQMVAAVQKIGGAQRLTAAEQARVNAVVTEAISKYRVLGETAPRAMVELERATRATDKTTGGFSATLKSLGKDVLTMAAGFFTAQAAFNGLRAVMRALTDEIKLLTVHGAAVGDVTENFEHLTQAAGQTGSVLLGVLREGTHRTIDDFRLMTSVNENLAAGLRLTDAQYRTLATGAFALAQARGIDVATAFDTMNDAMLTGRTRALARLTGVINETKAEEKFARSLKTTADQLNEAGKLEARRIAILEAVGAATGRLGDQLDGLDERVAQAQTAWTNFQNELGRTVSASPVLAAALDAITEGFNKGFGTKQADAIKTIAKLIDDLAIGFVGVAQAGISAGGFLIKEFIAVYKILADLRQLIDLTALGFEGLAFGLAKTINVATFGKAMGADLERIRGNMKAINQAITERGQRLQQADAAQKAIDSGSASLNKALAQIQARMQAARGSAATYQAAMFKAGGATKELAAGLGQVGESFISASKDGDTFAKNIASLSQDVGRGLSAGLTDQTFVKEFETKLDDAIVEFQKFGKTGAQIPENIRRGFERLMQIRIGELFKMETTGLKDLSDAVRGLGTEIMEVDEAIREIQGKSIEATQGALRSAAATGQNIEFQRAEFAIEQAKRLGGTWKQVYAMESALSHRRLEVAIADADREFEARVKLIKATGSVAKNEYDALAAEHNATVQEMVEAWQQGEILKRQELEKTHTLAGRLREALKVGLDDVGRAATGNLFSSLVLGGDRGQARDAAKEAKQHYEDLKRSGTASAEAITKAFDEMRDAEQQAHGRFADRFIAIWHSITSAVTRLLDQLLEDFLTNFLGGLLRGIAGANLGKTLGTALMGGATGAALGGGAALASSGVAASVAGVEAAALGGGGAAAGGAAGAGLGGLGGAAAAFATNPFTIAAAAGIGAFFLGRKLFGGGEEAKEVNPRRDQFLAQFGGSDKLAAQLTAWTGEPGGGRLHQSLREARTLAAFRAAEQGIVAIYAQHRRTARSFIAGGFVPPNMTVPAMLHGGRRGELIVPLDGAKRPAAPTIIMEGSTLTINSRSIDTEDARRFMERVAFPEFNRALLLQRHDLAAAIRRTVEP